MKLKTSVSLMVALVLGLVTAKVGSDLLKKYGGANASGVKIVVAKRDLPPGHVIDTGDVTLSEVSPRLVPAKAAKDVKDVVGRTVVTQVINGQTIFEGLLAPKGAGSGFEAIVPKGMRVVTIDVSESSGVAAMLIPGSKVDVITTLRRGSDTIAKAIVENVRVQNVMRGRTGYTTKGGQTSAIETGPVKAVTLFVTPKQAATIELANSSGGKLRLALRGNDDGGATADGSISANELLGIEEEPDAEPVVVEAPPADAFVEPAPTDPANRRTVTIIRGRDEQIKTYDEEKREEGSGVAPSAAHDRSAGADSRTASGDAPDASPRTEVPSVTR